MGGNSKKRWNCLISFVTVCVAFVVVLCLFKLHITFNANPTNSVYMIYLSQAYSMISVIGIMLVMMVIVLQILSYRIQNNRWSDSWVVSLLINISLSVGGMITGGLISTVIFPLAIEICRYYP